MLSSLGVGRGAPIRAQGGCQPLAGGNAACAAAPRTRGRQPAVFSLLPITLFPSGRAARVRVSDAFHLPPICYCDRQGVGCHPRGVHLYPAGASPSRKRWTQTLHRQHSCLPGQAKNETAAMLSQSKFFHRMWTNLFAVAGIREPPPAGVTRKKGQGPLLPARRPRRPHPSP